MSKVTEMSTKICERFARRAPKPERQLEIAELAYQFWLARAFRDGSPQEDWLRAQRKVCRRRCA
jgi:Protein of unknown function (DUF2934)